MKVVIDRARCVGSGDCVEIAPTVFALDGDNIAILLETTPATDDDTLFAAAEECPAQAIYLYDDTGNELYPKL
jgi:ferredoxin